MSELTDEMRELAAGLGPAGGRRLVELAAEVDRLELAQRRSSNHARRNAKQRDRYKRNLINVRDLVSPERVQGYMLFYGYDTAKELADWVLAEVENDAPLEYRPAEKI